jgi:hypothetical protein
MTMVIIAAITIIVAQTREATVKKAEEDIKASEKRNTTFITN